MCYKSLQATWDTLNIDGEYVIRWSGHDLVLKNLAIIIFRVSIIFYSGINDILWRLLVLYEINYFVIQMLRSKAFI